MLRERGVKEGKGEARATQGSLYSRLWPPLTPTQYPCLRCCRPCGPWGGVTQPTFVPGMMLCCWTWLASFFAAFAAIVVVAAAVVVVGLHLLAVSEYYLGLREIHERANEITIYIIWIYSHTHTCTEWRTVATSDIWQDTLAQHTHTPAHTHTQEQGTRFFVALITWRRYRLYIRLYMYISAIYLCSIYRYLNLRFSFGLFLMRWFNFFDTHTHTQRQRGRHLRHFLLAKRFNNLQLLYTQLAVCYMCVCYNCYTIALQIVQFNLHYVLHS